MTRIESLQIRIRGEDVWVPSLVTDAYRLVRTGRWIRLAQLFDEELVDSCAYPSWKDVVEAIQESGFRADLFTFARPFVRDLDHLELPHITDNLAVLDTTSYDRWWNDLPQEGRKNVRLAAKRGVAVRPAELDDEFVNGVKAIYDETPMRQGRQFWHYQRDLERVRAMNATYLDRSQLVGAYVGDEMVGFVKYVRVDTTAVLIQILSMDAHRDKRPIYALLQQTVELCHRQGLERLIYGKYDYAINQESSLKEFKRRNGFVELRFPRYFVPLNTWGRTCIATGLHLGWRNLLPAPFRSALHRARSRILQSLYKTSATRNG